MGLREYRERTQAAQVLRRNGAYLIFALGEMAVDARLDAVVDAARSLPTAKRVARKLAGEFGFAGQARWNDNPAAGFWELEMTFVGEEWDGEIDDD